MASNIINATKQVNELTKVFQAHMTAITETAQKLAILNKEYAKTPGQFLSNQEKINNSNKKVNDTTEKLTRTRTRANQKTSEEIVNQRALRRASDLTATANSRLVGAYANLNAQYILTSKRLQDLIIRGREAGQSQRQFRREVRSLSNEVQNMQNRLKSADAAVGRFNRNVGNYPKTFAAANRGLRSFLSAFGLVSGIFLFARAIQDAFRVLRDFDQAQADLAAILGVSRKETVALTKQAKELGATTAFTATQVAQLQIELSKLGFTEKQILASTKAVEDLAIATGVEAARAAKLAGAAIRGFNLDAEEANRVASVLAVSTTKSASSFETLEVSLPKVSAIAKGFNFTIEDTVALLSGLQNAGFEASIAGTSLRQIFLQLADSNGALARRLGGNVRNFDELVTAFGRLEEEGIDLAEAFDLTNARSVAAFKVFLQGAEDLKVLRNEITDVEDGLRRLAETKLDSLAGDIKLLTSAWEGFILSVEDGEGAISNFVRGAIQSLTSLFEFLKELNQTPEEIQEAYSKGLELKAYEEALSDLELRATKTGMTLEEVARESFFTYRTEADNARVEVNRLKMSIDNARAIIASGGQVTSEASDGLVNFKSSVQQAEKNVKAYKNELAFLEKEYEQASATLAIKEGKLKAVNESIRSNTVETEKNTQSQKKSLEAVEGSIKFLENQIALLVKQQSMLATTGREWQEYQAEIDATTLKLEQLKASFTGIENVLKAQELATESLTDATKKLNDELVQDANDATNQLERDAKDRQEKILRIERDSANLQKALRQDLVDSSIDLANAIFDGKIMAIDREIEAERNKFAVLLDNERLSDEQRDVLEAQRDEKNAQLMAKRAEEERRAFLFNQLLAVADIGINLAKTISAINLAAATIDAITFGVGGAAYRAANIPIAIGIAATQTAAVLARSIPQFEKGTQNAPEGWALTQEKRPEPITDKKGNLKTWGEKGGAKYTWLEKGDKVYKSQNDFLKNMVKNVFVSGKDQISLNDKDIMLNYAFATIKDDIVKGSKEGVRQGLKGFKVINNNKLDMGHQIWKKNKGYA